MDNSTTLQRVFVPDPEVDEEAEDLSKDEWDNAM